MLSISAALSTIHNPRGLEASYKAAWISTLRDACAFSNRLCVSTEGYVTVSGTVMRELRLQTVERENEQTRAGLGIRTRVANLLAGGTAQSSRITQAELSNIRHEKQVLEKSERVARVERRAIERERDECSFLPFSQPQHILIPMVLAPEDADMSFGNESAHDSAAKDLRPDLYVMHIIGGTIREPSANDVLDLDPSLVRASQTERDAMLRCLLTQHRARCGIKTIHTCKVLVGELKPLPSRMNAFQSNIDIDVDEDVLDGHRSHWANKWYTVFKDSIQQLMDDCAVHFIADSAPTTVIGVVSSGPFWHWAEISKDDIPSYDFLNMQPDMNLYDKFFELFPHTPDDCLVLGSETSDEEINKMRKVMYKMIGSEHPELPPFPLDFNFQLIPDTPRDPSFS